MSTLTAKKKKNKLDTTPTREEIKRYKALAVPWSETLPHTPGCQMVLEANSFNTWTQEYVDWLGLDIKPGPARTFDKAKRYRLQLRKFPFNEIYQMSYGGFTLGFAPRRVTKATLPMYYGGRESYRVTFDADVDILILSDNCGEPWMSLTPNEIFMQRPGVKRAKGNVLIGGLGLGWMTRRVLERPSVKHVTVIEKSQCVIDTFGKPFKDDPRVTFVCEDVYKYLKVTDSYFGDNHLRYPAQVADDSPLQQFDSVLFDIWDSINGCGDDELWTAVRKQAKSAWQWGTMRSCYG